MVLLPERHRGDWRRWLAWALGGLLAVGLAWLLWQWANDMSGVRREAPKVPMIIPLPPPPPPPPEPPPPEPQTPVEEIPEPEPTPEPEPIEPLEEAPSPADDLAEAMQIDGEAQAGSDAFNIGAGRGGGMAGSGGGRLGNGTYSQFLGYAFQRLLRDDPELRHQAYRLQVEVWIDAAGRLTRAELTGSSGDPQVDARVLELLRGSPPLERPPASLTLPVRIDLQGRRPA